mmetsp:Transcript_16768/g.44120  ORF Transcript_16768/g.44120 Transcript_16768/m.44120 type:complete len:91 (+) Transcript_16768:214-486(+)|eukprot:CAMPEP_0177514294 /NCGR_PEP_ID=MMETSP0369-20130122/44236_1 /TAXON_ID=447022 ORGANISM="Scrippsiella hangoei-like, Strain SHHI-4" /NCGR_SAMPLE_ID=MMETSP0369 /ASSEMBLY_ACC=CAM_ASM_000364 /LENGTH=90 /DNA_ID=CAMNT_0018992967 /DNA_START=132 /DNA_END=404 /DNA_ORIENTATION=+
MASAESAKTAGEHVAAGGAGGGGDEAAALRSKLEADAKLQDVTGRLVCQNMMFVWHVIFGEKLNLPHRMFDPQLPLFLKTRNVRTAYMDL